MDRILQKETIDYIRGADIDHRKKLGQYFTPENLRISLLSKLPKEEGVKILDPGCGTGEFLLSAREIFNKPNLYGWEIDRRLSRISRKLVPGAQVETVDTLMKETEEKFDFIIGNPPYFEFKPSEDIREKYGEMINGRANIYTLFIYKSIKLLKEGGYLAFVVPPSMNNGAYFKKLREFIVENCNIEYLSIQEEPDMFEGALQSVMLLILKKGPNKGDYIFRKNGILIFSENADYLKKEFQNSTTLYEMGYQVRTGRLVWNQNKEYLTDDPGSVTIIWSHNITKEGIRLNNREKPQYVRSKEPDLGPAIVVNRIVGRPGNGIVRAAVIPHGEKFIAENHVNVIFPSQSEGLYKKKARLDLGDVLNQINSENKIRVFQQITGNTQISKTELERLFPISWS